MKICGLSGRHCWTESLKFVNQVMKICGLSGRHCWTESLKFVISGLLTTQVLASFLPFHEQDAVHDTKRN